MVFLKKSSFFFRSILLQKNLSKTGFLAFFASFFYNLHLLSFSFHYFRFNSKFISLFSNKIFFSFFKPYVYLFQCFSLVDFVSFVSLDNFNFFLVGFCSD